MQNPRDLFLFLAKDVRKRDAYLAQERAGKTAAYAKKRAELEEYRQALKDLGRIGEERTGDGRWNPRAFSLM